MVRRRLSADWARPSVILLLALGVRLLYVGSTSPDAPIASVDAWGYHRLALNLDAGNGFSLRRAAPFVPDSIRTPLYPAFLWLVRRLLGPSPRAAAIVQAILDSCTTMLTWWLAGQLAGRRAGRAAALLYALNPTQVRYAAELLTETLLSLLLALSLCALLMYLTRAPRSAGPPIPKSRYWLAASALFVAMSILCKPNMLWLPLAWVPAIALAHGRRWRRTLVDAGLLVGIAAAALVPWLVRNQTVFGRPFLSTAFEGNVSRVSAPAALAASRGEYAVPWSSEWDRLFAELVDEAAQRFGWTKPWESLSARELDRHNHQVYLVARKALAQRPGPWLSSHLLGIARYLEPQTYRVCYAGLAGREWPPDVLDDAVLHTLREVARGRWGKAGEIIASERWGKLTAAQRFVWWGTLAGQVIGLALMVRGTWLLRRSPAAPAALLLTVAYALLLPGPIAYERFRVPVTSPILALVGAPVGERGATERCCRDALPCVVHRPVL